MLASNNGDFPASLTYVAEAREVFARTGDTELESTALAQGATTYFNLGRYAEAQAALEETLPIFRRSGHRYRETIDLGNLASIALMRGQLASAEKWAREAVENAAGARGARGRGDVLARAGSRRHADLALRRRPDPPRPRPSPSRTRCTGRRSKGSRWPACRRSSW